MVTIVPTDGQAYRVTEATAMKLVKAGLIVRDGNVAAPRISAAKPAVAKEGRK